MKRFEPRYQKIVGPGKKLLPGCLIDTDIKIIDDILGEAICRDMRYGETGEAYAEVRFVRGINSRAVEALNAACGEVYIDTDEGYLIDSTGDVIIVRSATDRGLFYGAQALCAMIRTSRVIPAMQAFSYPIVPERGVKVYLPGTENIPYFKEFVDMVAAYGHNTIMIEVGGAMAFASHPEINIEWEKYCKVMSEHSGKTIEIQEHTFGWHKNSIHVENGCGSYLSQDTVRELVAYCRERFLEVIPEVPCLSHCDYLLLGNPDIAERPNDPYPDTYCPSNPKSYRLLFDIMEEIIDVFEPDVMHIGHDEWYTFGICPRCKGKKPEDLYADDIQKIYEFLKSHGVTPMMWSEKLLDAHNKEGKPSGGAYIPAGKPEWMSFWSDAIEAVHPAIELVPRDMKMLHWYWSMGEEYDNVYHRHGMPVTYGNFHASSFTNWQKRVNAGIVLGGLTSNWSTLKQINLQRNGMLFEVAYSMRMFWDPDFDDPMREQASMDVLDDLYAYANHDAMHSDGQGRYFKAVHQSEKFIEYQGFADGIFIEDDVYLLGHYVVSYEDGVDAKVPVYYGESISNKALTLADNASAVHEVASRTLPVFGSDGVWYETYYANPRMGITMKGVRYEASGDAKVNVQSVEIV